MRLDQGRESENIEDRRGESGGLAIGGRGLGVGTVVLALVAWYFGIDPSRVLAPSGQTAAPVVRTAPAHKPPRDDDMARFVSKVLADTEDTWHALFRAAGQRYREPRLALYTGATPTACGRGQAAMGPFYCPADEKVYIDLAFYQDLKARFKAPGDFAQAYVIAHEIGHHVQNLTGISDKVEQARRGASQKKANALSVRLELQADCFAGIWAHHANRSRQVLEKGDIEEALNAATAIGDDRLQQQARGYAVPESFTHGSSAQRVRWFGIGLQSGDLKRCNTFQVKSL